MEEKKSFTRACFEFAIKAVINLAFLFVITAVFFPLWDAIAVKHFSAPKLTLIEFFGLCLLGRCIFGFSDHL